MGEEAGGPCRLALVGRAAIHTGQPFKSVKEAVMLFGEVVAPKLRQMRGEKASSSVAEELEETGGSLSETREENNRLANRIKHLKQELERATREIEWLKLKHFKEEVAPMADPEINAEGIKFIENATRPSTDGVARIEGKQKSVKFASPLSLTSVIMDKAETAEPVTQPSSANGLKKRTRRTKKGVVSEIARLFSKWKSRDDHE